jgi:hypothetical protein
MPSRYTDPHVDVPPGIDFLDAKQVRASGFRPVKLPNLGAILCVDGSKSFNRRGGSGVSVLDSTSMNTRKSVLLADAPGIFSSSATHVSLSTSNSLPSKRPLHSSAVSLRLSRWGAPRNPLPVGSLPAREAMRGRVAAPGRLLTVSSRRRSPSPRAVRSLR